MKKLTHLQRAQSLICCFCLLAGLTGCIGETLMSSPAVETSSVLPSDNVLQKSPNLSIIKQESDISCNLEALSAYREVLQNQREFMTGFRKEDMDYGMTLKSQSMTLDEYLDAWDVPNPRFFAFALCDLDYDDTPEVILDMVVNNDYYVGRFILRYEGGAVYGYHLNYRGFSALKTDGSFEISDGAFDHGSARILFDQEFYAYDNITYCRSEYDEKGNMLERYYVDRTEAAKDAFNVAIQQQQQKPDVEWYDFTDDNIAKYF